MTEPKKTGRPPLPPEERLIRRAFYLPPDVWAKIDAYGKEWARLALRRAKPPKG